MCHLGAFVGIRNVCFPIAFSTIADFFLCKKLFVLSFDCLYFLHQDWSLSNTIARYFAGVFSNGFIHLARSGFYSAKLGPKFCLVETDLCCTRLITSNCRHFLFLRHMWGSKEISKIEASVRNFSSFVIIYHFGDRNKHGLNKRLGSGSLLYVF